MQLFVPGQALKHTCWQILTSSGLHNQTLMAKLLFMVTYFDILQGKYSINSYIKCQRGRLGLQGMMIGQGPKQALKSSFGL